MLLAAPYRYVKAVKRLEELVTAEGMASEGIDHFFNFGSNRVATYKIGVIEDGAEEALG